MGAQEEKILVEKFLIMFGRALSAQYSDLGIEQAQQYTFKYVKRMETIFGKKSIAYAQVQISYCEEHHVPLLELSFSPHFEESHFLAIKEFLQEFVHNNPGLRIDVDWEQKKL